MTLPDELAQLEAAVPWPFRTMTWDEIERSLVERGASVTDAARGVAELRAQGMSPGCTMWCIAQAAP